MVRLLSNVLVGLLATFLLGTSVNGESLRSLISGRLQAGLRNELEKKKRSDGLICKSDTKKTDDRTCEPPEGTSQKSKVAARCHECVQECHVYGDPHVSPFQNSCTIKVFDQASDTYGWWTYVDVPGSKVEAWVTDRKRNGKIKRYITKVRVNGKVEMDTGDFKKKEECAAGTTGRWIYFDLKSDKGEPVQHELYLNCRVKNDYKQLEILSRFIDSGATEVNANPARSQSSMTGLAYFAKAKGACVDWEKYGFDENDASISNKEKTKMNCDNQSKLKQVNGTKCTCAAECAAWGDPHFSDYARKNSKKTSDTFLVPKAADMTPFDRVAYSFDNRFASFFEVDACEFIVTAEVWMLKPSAVGKYATCDQDSGNDGFLEPNDYDIVRVNAEDACKDGTSDGKDRTVIQIPDPTAQEFGAASFDEGTQSYNLGRYAHTLDGRLVPVDAETQDIKQCLKDQGNGDEPDFEVEMGGVKISLKCHQRPDLTYYFNLCNDRDNMVQKTLTSSKNGAQIVDEGIMSFLDVEKAGQSAGWCATGDYKGKGGGISVETSQYEQRAAGEAQGFKFINNVDDV